MAGRSDRARRTLIGARLMLRRARRACAAVARDAKLRERAAASGAFALIFAFLAGSVDYLITGGPDWNPGTAEAAQPVSVRFLQPSSSASPEPVIRAPGPSTAFDIDYSIASEPLLGGPDYLTAREADRGNLYRQVSVAAPDEPTPETPNVRKPLDETELEYLFFGASSTPDTTKQR